MSKITFQDQAMQTAGELPAVKTRAPGFTLTKTDLSEVNVDSFSGSRVVLNIFPSIDTPVCAASVRRFNEDASKLDDTVVLCISADLPFAHKRFCEADGLNDVIPLSVFRSKSFGRDYGVEITDGPLRGLLARAVVVMDKSGIITYTELVPEISQEPDYASALAAVKAA